MCQSLHDLLSENELKERVNVYTISSPEIERSFALKKGSFFLACSDKFFFVRESDSSFDVVPPYTFFLSNKREVHVRGGQYSSFVTSVIVDGCVYGDQEMRVVNALMTKKQLNFDKYRLLYENIIEYSDDMNKEFFFQFLIYSLPVLLGAERHKGEKGSLFDRVEQIIRNNAHNADLYLEQVASLCFCSKRTLQKTLALNNTSFSELTKKIRLELFCEFLLSSKLNVEVISYKCGFNSSSYAVRMFRSTIGLTPNQYRRKFSCGK